MKDGNPPSRETVACGTASAAESVDQSGEATTVSSRSPRSGTDKRARSWATVTSSRVSDATSRAVAPVMRQPGGAVTTTVVGTSTRSVCLTR